MSVLNHLTIYFFSGKTRVAAAEETGWLFHIIVLNYFYNTYDSKVWIKKLSEYKHLYSYSNIKQHFWYQNWALLDVRFLLKKILKEIWKESQVIHFLNCRYLFPKQSKFPNYILFLKKLIWNSSQKYCKLCFTICLSIINREHLPWEQRKFGK